MCTRNNASGCNRYYPAPVVFKPKVLTLSVNLNRFVTFRAPIYFALIIGEIFFNDMDCWWRKFSFSIIRNFSSVFFRQSGFSSKSIFSEIDQAQTKSPSKAVEWISNLVIWTDTATSHQKIMTRFWLANAQRYSPNLANRKFIFVGLTSHLQFWKNSKRETLPIKVQRERSSLFHKFIQFSDGRIKTQTADQF